MIHIATVHHLSDKWIDIQLKYFEKHIKTPYQVYAFLNGIKKDHSQKFHFSSNKKILLHEDKLNILAQKICEVANDSDLIMFIDGDAFPINNLDTFLDEKFKTFPLIAIQRSLDFGEKYPHPAFCVAKVDFWKKIDGDWRKGFKFRNEVFEKEVMDVGGYVLKELVENNIEWYKLLRSNNNNIHPQWFGIYDNLIYHHGAGFRKILSRIDTQKIQDSFNTIKKIQSKIIFLRRFLYKKTIDKNTKLSDSIFNSILKDEHFYKKLT